MTPKTLLQTLPLILSILLWAAAPPARAAGPEIAWQVIAPDGSKDSATKTAVDAQGNIYVALSLGCSIIRKFTPEGKLVWEEQAHAFVDSYDFSAASDGQEIYGTDEVFQMDYAKGPGKEWSLKAISRDAIANPNDPRNDAGTHGSTILREVQGHRLLYSIGMYAGGYRIYAFEKAPSMIVRYAGTIGKDGTWAWDVDENGGIWTSDSGKILYYPLKGFTTEGFPLYDLKTPQTFTPPAVFTGIEQSVARAGYNRRVCPVTVHI
jgi:hypothetical protein